MTTEYKVTYKTALYSMQEIMMEKIVELLESKQCLRIINEARYGNAGILRCTDKGSLNTLLGIKYDFQYESATFYLTYNGNEVKSNDGSDKFYMNYDRNPDDAFTEVLNTIDDLLS